jgi:hypothetical protein
MRHKIPIALLVLLISALTDARNRCGAVEELHQEWSEMPVTILMPQDGSISGFRMGSLYAENGSKFIPKSVGGAVCVVPLLFDQTVLDAIVAGAKQGELKRSDGDVDDQMESIYAEINERLDHLFEKDGLPKGTGLSKVLWHLGNELGMGSPSLASSSSLAAAIRRKGIYSPNHQIWYVLAGYLDSRGIKREFIKKFIANMREKDRAMSSPQQQPH